MLGLLSLIFWGLMFVVTLKYVVFVLRADHDGEGGILALDGAGAATRPPGGSSARPWLWGAIGHARAAGRGSTFYGDSLITPAISILSAVEGLEVQAPGLQPFVIPITIDHPDRASSPCRSKGTGAVGKIFGPVMLLWFVVILRGGRPVAGDPAAAGAGRRSTRAMRLRASWCEHRGQSLAVLGAVFLAFTGGEALYADMGHFGASARSGWPGSSSRLPALMLNYFGQGALVLANPAAIDNPVLPAVSGLGACCRWSSWRRWPR